MKLKAGDLVACRDKYYFDQLGVKANLGVVLENKKSAYKVMFDQFEKGYWLNQDQLAKKQKGVEKWVQEVSDLVRWLNAESFELEKAKSGKKVLLELILEKISFQQMEDIKKGLGKRLIRLECLPHLMAEIKLEVEFAISA